MELISPPLGLVDESAPVRLIEERDRYGRLIMLILSDNNGNKLVWAR
jgi:hypothetical protein